jgi:hypothetical protein
MIRHGLKEKLISNPRLYLSNVCFRPLPQFFFFEKQGIQNIHTWAFLLFLNADMESVGKGKFTFSLVIVKEKTSNGLQQVKPLAFVKK